MQSDPWHFARTELAKQILNMFECGLSTALVFFAPRRMGKTEFLYKDIKPWAEKNNWKVLYFSFLDCDTSPANEFAKTLAIFADQMGALAKARRLLKKIKKINGEAIGIKAGIELGENVYNKDDMKKIIEKLALKNKVLLLMDEIQVLSQDSSNAQFVAALRTALDINKDKIKVIFMGSSQEELRLMFSKAKAPFFHFGQNLPFPELCREFTDHLVEVFKTVTQRKLDSDKLWDCFQELQRVPQLARSLVERIALNPNSTLQEAKNQLLSEVFTARAFVTFWDQCSELEKLLLCEIAQNKNSSLFSNEIRSQLANKLGIEELQTFTVQSAIRVLQRKKIIGQLSDRSNYVIDDPNFKSWILQNNSLQEDHC